MSMPVCAIVRPVINNGTISFRRENNKKQRTSKAKEKQKLQKHQRHKNWTLNDQTKCPKALPGVQQYFGLPRLSEHSRNKYKTARRNGNAIKSRDNVVHEAS